MGQDDTPDVNRTEKNSKKNNNKNKKAKKQSVPTWFRNISFYISLYCISVLGKTSNYSLFSLDFSADGEYEIFNNFF